MPVGRDQSFTILSLSTVRCSPSLSKQTGQQYCNKLQNFWQTAWSLWPPVLFCTPARNRCAKPTTVEDLAARTLIRPHGSARARFRGFAHHNRCPHFALAAYVHDRAVVRGRRPNALGPPPLRRPRGA